MNNELTLQALRKKHSGAVGELSDQMDAVQKCRVKLEKEKQQLLRELEGAQVKNLITVSVTKITKKR